MSAQSITPPYPVFTDIDGDPLDAGYIYIGEPGLNPETNPVSVYWDAALTIPAAQPIRTIGGYASRSGTPGRLYVAGNYSIMVKNKNGSLIFSNINSPVLYSVGFVNVKEAPFNAIGDGVVDDTAAIQAAIDSIEATGGRVYFPPGTYRTTAPIDVAYPANNIALEGAQEYASVILADHTGIALNLATNNQPYVGHLFIKRNTIGARGSRTGTGIRVNGDAGGGSVIQAFIEHCRIEGFARGMDMDTTWLSHFSRLTLKQNDISYYFQNNTNYSTTFIACQSNNSVSQHIYADGGTAECGATFIGCEFEGAYKFPAIHVAGGVNFGFYFNNCYLDENNFGSDAGSTFQFARFDIAGTFHVSGNGFNAAGMADARLIYGRRNASVGKWNIQFHNCVLSSGRSLSPDIDVDILAASDIVYIAPSCRYNNIYSSTVALTNYSQGSAGSLFKETGGINRIMGLPFEPWATAQKSSDPNILDSYAESSVAVPFNPTWANLTIGNGTTSGSYVKVGQLVIVTVTLTWGSTTSASGSFSVNNLPFTCESNESWYGSGNALDSGTANYPVRTTVQAGTANLLPNVGLVSGTNVLTNTINAATPFTWTTGDSLKMTCAYRSNS